MADPVYLKRIKKGVKAWNQWRRHIGADSILSDLTFAPLQGAELTDANFLLTDLSGANLSGARLDGADLRYAKLQGANLTKTFLGFANLSGANLSGANLTEARFNNTILADTNLSRAIGLETCWHVSASTIDHRTLAKSGKLPLPFLRGCGLPDTLIEFLPSLLNTPLQFYSCFISYSSKNQIFADRLYVDLQNKDVRCWLATEDLKIGDKTRIAIDESIRFHDKLLIVLSKHSVASNWVEQEVETALDRERKEKRTVLFPIRLDDTVMKIDTGWPALIKNTRNIGDFRKWRNPESYSTALDRLLRDLKASE